MNYNNEIFSLSSPQLPISNGFKQFLATHQIETFDKLKAIKPIDLMKMEGFNSHLLLEMINLMEENGISLE